MRMKIVSAAGAAIFLVFPLVISAQATTTNPDLQALVKQLQAQVQSLQAQIIDLNTQLQSVKTELKLTRVLAKGATGDDVKQLQEFLKTFPDVYPEGLVTGYFGPLTEAAIKRFQEKQGVVNTGSPESTGFGQVGPKTVARLNALAITDTGAGQSESAAAPSTTETSTSSLSALEISTPTATTTALMCARDSSACSSKKDCESAKFFWYTVSCHPTPPPSGSCAASYVYCSVGAECSANGWYSCRNSCYGSADACLGQTYVPPAVSSTSSTPPPSSGSGSSGSGASVVTTTTGTTAAAVATSTTAATVSGTVSDTTPPSVPTNLSASSVALGQIDLSWTASTDNVEVSGYKIYRGGTQISTIASATSTTISYSDTGLQSSTAYTYTIVAYDAAGNNSAQSASASATPLSPPPSSAPAAPSNFSATVSGTTVTLTWTDNSNDELYFGFHRQDSAGHNYTLNAADMNATSMTDVNLSPDTYIYTIRAYNNYGSSAWSAPVSVTVSGTTPTASSTSLDLRKSNLAAVYSILESLKIVLEKLLQLFQ